MVEANNGRSNNSHQACAACKHQKRKCTEDCVVAPYFPRNKTDAYERVVQRFSESFVLRKLECLKNELDTEAAAESMIWVAECWYRDPINGPRGRMGQCSRESQTVLLDIENRGLEKENVLLKKELKLYQSLLQKNVVQSSESATKSKLSRASLKAYEKAENKGKEVQSSELATGSKRSHACMEANGETENEEKEA